jgi:hypothetical protein
LAETVKYVETLLMSEPACDGKRTTIIYWTITKLGEVIKQGGDRNMVEE